MLLLGTNLGQREQFLATAQEQISQHCGAIIKSSSIYETDSWGFDGAPFLNQVICVETHLQPAAMLEKLQMIEKQLGRKRKYQKAYLSRTIDIDILYFNHLIIKSPDLEIPHPRLHLRKFTLIPLAETLPEFSHPILAKTHLELLAEVEDICKVSPFQSTK